VSLPELLMVKSQTYILLSWLFTLGFALGERSSRTGRRISAHSWTSLMMMMILLHCGCWPYKSLFCSLGIKKYTKVLALRIKAL
jgi:hypothetical protein